MEKKINIDLAIVASPYLEGRFMTPTANEALRDPWLATTNTPSPVDLSLALRQNWSPRAKWCSAVIHVEAANRFAAAASRLSTQSSGKLHEEVVWGAFGPVCSDLEKDV